MPYSSSKMVQRGFFENAGKVRKVCCKPKSSLPGVCCSLGLQGVDVAEQPELPPDVCFKKAHNDKHNQKAGTEGGHTVCLGSAPHYTVMNPAQACPLTLDYISCFQGEREDKWRLVSVNS